MAELARTFRRIGSNLKKNKKLFDIDNVKFSFNTFKGVSVTGMTSCSTVLTKNEKKTDVYVLEDLVNKAARVRIQSKLPDSRWCFQKSNDEPDFKLDWSDVEIIPAKPNFEPIIMNKEVQSANRVISNTMLKNGSKISQWHKIKTERQILSSCESYLTNGCVIGGKVGIALPAPDALGFSAGFSLRRPKQNFDEESIAWVGTDCIKIPKGDTISVTIQSKEQLQEFDFTALIGIKGAVYALYCNPDVQTEVKLRISMREIFLKEIPELITREENDTIYFTITGRCKFKYDMVHEITINST